ncbi:MAG: hypothetical protein ABR968_02380 [Bacteroidales bacterium]
MNRIITKRLFINIILYIAIALAIYWLYSPLNNDPNNKTSSSVHFVYQKF